MGEGRGQHRPCPGCWGLHPELQPGQGEGGRSRPVRTPGGLCPQAPRRPRPWRKGGWRGACGNRRQGRVKVRRELASAAWRAEGGRGLESQQLCTKFILNHTPRSSQLIAELETIRELPNYCQLERANQAPSPTPRPTRTTKCQTSLEADTRPPSLPSACQTQQRGPTKASTGRRTVTREGPLAALWGLYIHRPEAWAWPGR